MPAPGQDMGQLRSIAREASRRWPWLAPLGGARWADEDIDHAVSLLLRATEAGAFQRALNRGMTTFQIRAYLSTALRNRLVDGARYARRLTLLDQANLCAVPESRRARGRLEPMDLDVLVGRVLAELSARERASVARYLGIRGSASRDVPCSPRTYWRDVARFRHRFVAVVRAAGLSRDEAGDLAGSTAAVLGRTEVPAVGPGESMARSAPPGCCQ